MLTKEFHPDKLRDQLQMRAIARRRPLSCTFELTYRCNFRCPMCYIRMTDEQAAPYGRLRTADEWLDMARQVCEAGVVYLNLTGGECTTFPEFSRLYRELSEMGFRISLMSNAGAYTQELRELFREYPPYGVAVTLYGGSNETYEKVTGDPNGLDKVLDNIRFFKSIGVKVLLNFTMIRQNALDYPKVGKLCQQLGIPYTLITDITTHNRNPAYSDALNCRLSPAERACVACHPADEVELAMKNAPELEKALAHYVPPVVRPVKALETNDCIGSYSSATIYWNGEMNTCISMVGAPGYKPFEIGFEAAWAQIQADHAQRFRKPAVCQTCEMREDCLHNCCARNLEGTGDTLTPDPDTCRYVWLMRKYRADHSYITEAHAPDCN